MQALCGSTTLYPYPLLSQLLGLNAQLVDCLAVLEDMFYETPGTCKVLGIMVKHASKTVIMGAKGDVYDFATTGAALKAGERIIQVQIRATSR